MDEIDIRATFGTYVDKRDDGETVLTCGQCDWLHPLPAPFLLGDAARVSTDHFRDCPRRLDPLAQFDADAPS